MQNFLRCSFACFALLLLLPGFTQAQGSRGMLPSYFQLPSANDIVHFTSPQQPDFPTPVYPDAHRSSLVEGAVEVKLYVTSEGDVVKVDISVSSGDALFDEAALGSAIKAHFPVGYATVQGKPVDFVLNVPFYFLLSPDPEMYWHTRLELARIQTEYESAMNEFQGYLSERTKTTASRVESSQRRIERTVAAAKRLHRILAEKKESAILRLREEIAMTKLRLEDPDEQQPSLASDTFWRNAHPGQVVATVVMPSNTRGIVTRNSLSNNDLERLIDELELKKSYL